MEKWIEELFSEHVLEDAASRYKADAIHAKKLGDFENYVFEVKKNETPYILRLTHSSHRSKEEVEAELQWINYLHEHGVTVSLVHHSENGHLVETIDVKGSAFYVCLFDKAPGEPVRANDALSSTVFEKWGQITGKMHRVTKSYKPKGTKRARWDEGDLFDFGRYVTNKKDADIVKAANALVNQIKQLPESDDVFGLIHSDIHPGNFFYHEGDIYVFDFDDSSYHYLISDIAIPLYYHIWFHHRNEDVETRSKRGEDMLVHFLSGYLREHDMSDEWISRIPLFLALRDYELYAVFHKKWDVTALDEREAALLDQIRDRLVRYEPIVELNYNQIIRTVKA
ncbi:phosphotransferase enzyme family protein [Metabacillus iocasae]|uniref:Ser/Thr protein kinase RdoA (MazF antagonist) n=1 Tax=Priestia iocasae TaxID=2291674 RepID=A0ABS2QY40_9BACI|nr:phosphotransferase [Metabacillus iocasae]MBM7704409.1 Ser/Thr protein kinase RdoA (MazF antagonist) [Metabacillus iocasae]